MPQQVMLKPGLFVETFDNRVLGVIEDVDDDRFLLRPRLRGPYWLPDGLVRTVDTDRVRLHLDSSRLGRYRQPVRMTPRKRRGVLSRHLGPAPLTYSVLLTTIALSIWTVL